MNVDKKTIVIICLAVALVVVSWIAFKPAPKNYNEELLKHERDRLEKENATLQNNITQRDKKIAGFSNEIDSLKKLPPIIHTIYATKYKEIDSASAGNVAGEFADIFANNSVQ